MRYQKSILAGATMLALAGCGSTTALKSANPQVRKDEAAAEKIVQGCVSHGNFLTHSGRVAAIHCMAPPGQQVAFQKCATSALAKDGVLTKHERENLYADLAVCVEKHR